MPTRLLTARYTARARQHCAPATATLAHHPVISRQCAAASASRWTFTLRPVPGSPPPAPMHGAAAADFPPLPASPSRSERSDDSMTGAAGHAAAAVAAADDDGHLSASFADIAAIAAAPPLEQC